MKRSLTRCNICGCMGVEKHHIIFKSQGGTNNKENLLLLCSKCHFQIHHGLKSKEYQWETYKFINDLSLCWRGKLKHKIINILESKNERK